MPSSQQRQAHLAAVVQVGIEPHRTATSRQETRLHAFLHITSAIEPFVKHAHVAGSSLLTPVLLQDAGCI
jgi:hypothetical protein